MAIILQFQLSPDMILLPKQWRRDVTRRLIDLTGKQFGSWTVLSRAGSTPAGAPYWNCRCVCGKSFEVDGRSLRRGDSLSCGCLNPGGRHKKTDLTNTRVGKWLVVGQDGHIGTCIAWLCQCDCGSEKKRVNGASLRKGVSLSCGCEQRRITSLANYKHGHAVRGRSSRTHGSWTGMLSRCRDKNKACWKDYGGRGITVCDRWYEFANFLADMGECPPGLSLDRFPDRDGNYEPGNCRWATKKEQANNRRPAKKAILHLTDDELIEELVRRGYDMSSMSRSAAA